jgi:histidinol-phosphate aminotransferase
MTRSQGGAARYPDADMDQVVEAIAELHKVEPDQVALGCGSGEILLAADAAFLRPGKQVVVSEPTFEAVVVFAHSVQSEAVKVPQTGDYRHDLTAMAAACNERTGLVYVCNPNNPTGTIVSGEKLGSFLASVPPNVTILVDEAYHHFIEDPQYTSAFQWLDRTPNLIVVRTFSKIYGLAGMRLGYGVGSKEAIGAMRQHLCWSNANVAVLQAARASLGDAEHVTRHRQLNRDTRRWLCAELQIDGRSYIPSQTNFLMIDLGRDVEPVVQQFRDHHIMVGRKFPSMPNWLRVSIGTREEMEAFLARLRELVPVQARAA